MRAKDITKILFGAIVLGILSHPVLTADVKAAEPVSEAETDSGKNNTTDTAEILYDNETILGHIDTSKNKEEVDMYRCMITTKGYYTFSVVNNTDEDVNDGWKMSIYDKDMNMLEERYNISSLYTSKKYALAVGDMIYIRIEETNYSNSTNNRLYALISTPVAAEDWETEYNDTSGSATSLSGTINGTILKKEDVDYYRYKADYKGYVRLSFKNTTGDNDSAGNGWKVTVYDIKMNKLSEDITVKKDCDDYCFTVKKGTVLYIKIEPQSNFSAYYAPVNVQYTLSLTENKQSDIEKEPNNKFTKTDKIKNKKTGEISYKDGKDHYIYKALRSKKIKVKLVIKNKKSGKYMLKIYDSKKKLVKNGNKEITKKGTIAFKASKGKKYYIVVEKTKEAGNCNRLYELSVK